MRATRTYDALLRESFHPDVLRGALDRDRLFDRLWVATRLRPELPPVIGAERADLYRGDIPMFAAPWLMSGLASLYSRSGLANMVPPLANVAISNVPGASVPLYFAGARMTCYYPVSIAVHSMALNVTVQSYAGSLDFGPNEGFASLITFATGTIAPFAAIMVAVPTSNTCSRCGALPARNAAIAAVIDSG